MVLTDPGLAKWLGEMPEVAERAASIAGAAFVVIVGKWLQRRAARSTV